MTFQFSADQRIRHKLQFDLIFKTRKRLYGRYFLAYYRSNEMACARMGAITSKRNIRFAVMRNRIRRILKEQFRLNQHELPSLDIVFIAKREANKVENKELQQCIEILLKKLQAVHRK